MGPKRIWKTGEQLVLEHGGRKVAADVRLASGNGFSLFLEFEAVVDGCAGAMPVLWSETRERFENIATGSALVLLEASPPAEPESARAEGGA